MCWLSVPVTLPVGARTVVFTARVARIREREIGLVFFGAPAWAEHGSVDEKAETQRLGKITIRLGRKGST